MKNQPQTAADWQQRYRELEATCRLWMAAAEAREARIEELAETCERLQQRVARLSRIARRPRCREQGLRAQRLHRTPTSA